MYHKSRASREIRSNTWSEMGGKINESNSQYFNFYDHQPSSRCVGVTDTTLGVGEPICGR